MSIKHNYKLIERVMTVLLSLFVTGNFLLPTMQAYASPMANFKVVGNHVLVGGKQIYLPEGISVYGGLEQPKYSINNANIRAQIIAASMYWHSNTVRLQVAEGNLFKKITPGKTYNEKFLRAIINQVNLVHSLGMAVVINDQTEFTSRILGPTSITLKFWKVMSAEFKNQSYVIFDLFNEPMLDSLIKGTGRIFIPGPKTRALPYVGVSIINNTRSESASRYLWNLWKYGGKLNGVTYLGMQYLVNHIRSYGADNLIWIEGLNQARDLPLKKYLIQGKNIEYSIHHPNLNKSSSWAPIGNLAKIAPVVDGEWAQYQSPWAECFSKAYVNSSIYLNYLRQNDVGVIAWSLQAGSLVKGSINTIPKNLNSASSPTTPEALRQPSILQSSYDCGYEFGQGVGKLIQDYFAKNSTNSIP